MAWTGILCGAALKVGDTEIADLCRGYIRNILKVGKATRKTIMLTLISMGYHISDRGLRATIEEMIVEDKYSISSSEKGYALIKSDEDLKEAIAYLEKKVEALAIRKNCLGRNFRHYLVTQLDLFD